MNRDALLNRAAGLVAEARCVALQLSRAGDAPRLGVALQLSCVTRLVLAEVKLLPLGRDADSVSHLPPPGDVIVRFFTLFESIYKYAKDFARCLEVSKVK